VILSMDVLFGGSRLQDNLERRMRAHAPFARGLSARDRRKPGRS
jgi:hypothetical protein